MSGLWLSRLHVPHGIPRDTQAVHRTVMYAAPVGPAPRVLWVAPVRDVIIVQAGGPVPEGVWGGAESVHSAPVRLDWPVGARVGLSIIANPTCYVPSPVIGGRGKRVSLPEGQHEQWLAGRLSDAVDMDVIETQPLGVRHGQRHEMRVSHRLVAYRATGRVTDPRRLAHHIAVGVGPGKAYGAGLLLVSSEEVS